MPKRDFRLKFQNMIFSFVLITNLKLQWEKETENQKEVRFGEVVMELLVSKNLLLQLLKMISKRSSNYIISDTVGEV